MTRLTQRQHGFSIIAILLVIAVLAVVSGIFLIVNKQANRPAGSTKVHDISTRPSSTKPEDSVTPQPTTLNKLKIPELGISFDTPDSLQDLTYQIRNITLSDGSTVKGAYFMTKALAKISPQCAESQSSLAAMAAAPGTYPSDPSIGSEYGRLLKQFPESFVTYQSSSASCVPVSDTGSMKLYDSTRQALSESAKTVQLIPN